MSTEQSGQSSRVIFSFIVVLLFVIIGLQLWYMLDIKKQLETIQGEYDTLQSIINGDTSGSESSTMSAAAEDANSLNDIQQDDTQHQATSDNNESAATAPDNTQTTQLLQPPVSQPRSGNINPYYPPFRAYPEPFHGPYQGPYQGPSQGPSQGPFSRPQPEPYPGASSRVDRDIYDEIRQMRQKMREEMERAFRDRPSDRHSNSPRQQSNFEYHFKEDFSAPKMRVREDKRHYFVSLNIPGADENDVSVKLEGQRLTVVGKQKTQKQQSDPEGQFTFSHSRTGKFKRSITLREPVDERGLQTRIEKGMLMIRIPKRVL